ncbi:Grx4 family monothiol glutaredoxin [Candidatus Wolbachia massiliensis]|uniref:Glutaredoxin n=1 Tax=Candidatus Wolbachia massiliensis TaxID=1845000 RepID=A0A7L7YMT6_9RICK|nr:Grx4 family monothiol glutaredoxin [Candidatus Wolbachia massiliensis]QOD38368.1 Grx4 family monothiol glutaredoxin [Candidatus Wolbachia massiliensis]
MSNFEQIKRDIAENDVVLYMKGTSDFPQCGFSGLVVSILKNLNVKFKSINVLENGEIRESIKKFSDWPTIPQLYIKGKFIGGCDITREMYEKGELQSLLKEKNIIVE